MSSIIAQVMFLAALFSWTVSCAPSKRNETCRASARHKIVPPHKPLHHYDCPQFETTK